MLLGLLAAPPARAEEQDAKAHFASGQELFAHGSYPEAMQEFSAGYQLSHRPLFLFNMAECARLLGDAARARALYSQYIDEDPDGRLVATARERLAASPTPRVRPAPLPAADPAAPALATPAPADGVRTVELGVGVGAIILGGIGVGVAAILANDAQSDADQVAGLSHGGPWTSAQAALDAEGHRYATESKVLFIAGGAAILGGGVLCTLGLTRATHDVAVVPIRGGGGAIVWTGELP
jgi:hypothetical protein